MAEIAGIGPAIWLKMQIMNTKKYLIIGCGNRSGMYMNAVLETYRDRAELAALCDSNPHRLSLAVDWAREKGANPLAGDPGTFESLIERGRVDTVIITSVDRTHDDYIVRAMDAGCDVVVEKPLTIDARRLARIEEAKRRTGRAVRVTFNYRYAPRNSKVRKLLQHDGAVGTIKSVHFEWLLDTSHGADYFRRWHRDKRNSGGLMVHKATHHFDLVNWWLNDVPESVYASGDLVFYGRENAERRGMRSFGQRGSEAGEDDPFALDLTAKPNLKRMYYDAEKHDGYRRDENVFGYYISIEDDMSVLVEYRGGARMSYHLTAYSPWEGFNIAFNGDGGRLEYTVVESGPHMSENPVDNVSIRLFPLFGEPHDIPVPESDESGHGGGDARLLADIFSLEPIEDPLERAADHRAGMSSVMVGIAANRSMAAGRAVPISEIAPFAVSMLSSRL